MTFLLFFSALIFAAILLPFQLIAVMLFLLCVQAGVIKLAARFVMGGVPFASAFKAAILSSVFTVMAAALVIPGLFGGLGIVSATLILFAAIWTASVLAYSVALGTTLGASVLISLLTSVIGYAVSSFLDIASFVVR